MKKSIQPQALLFPNPVLVICTYDAEGKPNAATFAWGGIASSAPPAISVAVQKPRYTYDALINRKAFTANLVPAKYAAEADYFGLVSGRNADKFAAKSLTRRTSPSFLTRWSAKSPTLSTLVGTSCSSARLKERLWTTERRTYGAAILFLGTP